jgi:triosephosphate isomerase
METKTLRQPIIAANWKLHKTLSEARQFITDLSAQCPDPGPVEVLLAAPFTALAALQECLQGLPYRLAAQDLFWESHGAYTGEISAPLLQDVGCAYVIVGHSERRQWFGETDETVSKKSCRGSPGWSAADCLSWRIASPAPGGGDVCCARTASTAGVGNMPGRAHA